MDYGFVHEGRTFTPNGTPAIDPSSNDTRNAQIERAELERWAARPDRMLAYFQFPAETGGGLYRRSFLPHLHSNCGVVGTANVAVVTTWPGTIIGRITAARVYPHNFGGRFVSLTVRGTNGATYYGRASYDHGSCVMLRKGKG
jgi:hypothetical protein